MTIAIGYPEHRIAPIPAYTWDALEHEHRQTAERVDYVFACDHAADAIGSLTPTQSVVRIRQELGIFAVYHAIQRAYAQCGFPNGDTIAKAAKALKRLRVDAEREAVTDLMVQSFVETWDAYRDECAKAYGEDRGVTP